MYQPLPEFPPLYPTCEWWRLLFKKLPCPWEEAVAYANRESRLASRAWMRVALIDDTVLSLPVKGGASALKNRHPSSWQLAPEAVRAASRMEHTLATLYGSSPFYNSLAPLLRIEITDRALPSAAEICNAAFRRVAETLSINDPLLVEQLKNKILEGDPVVSPTVKQYSARISPRRSILDALFYLGPDAIFSLPETF